MNRLIEGLKAHWDLIRGRYRTKWVDSVELQDKCSAVLAEVRKHELGRKGHTYDDVPLSGDGGSETDLVLACLDGEKVVGAVRVTRFDEVLADPLKGSDFNVDPTVFGELATSAFLAHRMVLLPEYRGLGVAYLLMKELYAEALRRNVALCLLDCEPPLIRVYARLGFRPLGAPYSLGGCVYVPLVLINHDAEQLQRVDSPLLAEWRDAGGPTHEAARDWWARYVVDHKPPRTGFTYVDDEELNLPILHGLSDLGKAALLRNANRVPLQSGQLLIAQEDRGKWMALIEDGLVEVRKGDRVLRLLSRGEVAGELAFLLGVGRTADVRAGEGGATVIMLSTSAVSRLEDPLDQAALWKNLAMLLGRRILER